MALGGLDDDPGVRPERRDIVGGWGPDSDLIDELMDRPAPRRPRGRVVPGRRRRGYGAAR
jgi:hypothetical protein